MTQNVKIKTAAIASVFAAALLSASPAAASAPALPAALSVSALPAAAGGTAETEADIPENLADGLRMDTPSGSAANMTQKERASFLQKITDANAPEIFFGSHKSLLTLYLSYDQEDGAWKEYSEVYKDADTVCSDDRTDGLEEMKYLLSGESDCAEDYTQSLGIVRFLNCTGTAMRNCRTDPVTTEADTAGETLLLIRETCQALYAVTQLPEEKAVQLAGQSAAGLFVTAQYTLDPKTLEVRDIRTALHHADGSSLMLQKAVFRYDAGMTPLLLSVSSDMEKHLFPERFWDADTLRTVSVTIAGQASEAVCSVKALKDDRVSILLPDGYALCKDAALTQPWSDNGNYTDDLFLYAG